jgi:hypothetical protein
MDAPDRALSNSERAAAAQLDPGVSDESLEKLSDPNPDPVEADWNAYRREAIQDPCERENAKTEEPAPPIMDKELNQNANPR